MGQLIGRQSAERSSVIAAGNRTAQLRIGNRYRGRRETGQQRQNNTTEKIGPFHNDWSQSYRFAHL